MMDKKDIESLIRWHKAGLDEHRRLMAVSAIRLEEQTIKALEELKEKGDEK